MKKKPRQPRTIPFDAKLSAQLDRATVNAERGQASGKIRKRWYEWLIFGGRP